ncbi:MAG: iron-containing alcohol dehydrogenase, partial [Myxococcales bacterium]|nr:iron-containing alcohol dehydrogenase [Myxococcales bacterium]
MTVTWNFPTRILSGHGSLGSVPSEASALGGSRALVVSDPGVHAAGLTERALEVLKEAGLEAEIFAEVAGNPTDEHVEAAITAYRDAGADLVIALGGGSAIDVGKLVRIGGSHQGPLASYADEAGGSARIGPLPPMIAIPTTAGTGSEVGRSAVATLRATNRKTIFFAPHLIPSVAILDPELTVSMPAKLTAATGFDALTHNLEALSTKMHHPMAQAIAREGLGLVARYLERAVADGSDLEARGGMLEAATLGAVAFQKGLGACHSLAHPLSTETGMHHGLANALCLPAVIDYTAAS